MRAPPPSLRPIIGTPSDTARSITLWIFSPCTSPSDPPKMVASWLKMHTLRPSIVPNPVITPSVANRLASIPIPKARWRASRSSSWKLPSSRRYSIRSRAVILPLACWRSTERGEPAWRASSLRDFSSARRWDMGCSMRGEAIRASRGRVWRAPLLLDQLDEGTEVAFGMDEGHRGAPGTGPGDLVDDLAAGVDHPLESGGAVGHPV